ncbi:MAG: PA14 domain-containing protein, partial [Pirellulales bacterium]|nr:PA14 domain-containing protein [Pirellulales bacterium]
TSATRIDPTLRFPFGAAYFYELPYDVPSPLTTALEMTATFTGRIKADHTEDYIFRVVLDNEAYIYLDGNQIFHFYSAFAGTNFGQVNHVYETAAIPMTAGEWRDIEIRFFDDGGNAHFWLTWESPSTPLQDIPSCNLRPN